MPINPANLTPNYCKNCTHRYVCSIQANIHVEDENIAKFNLDNVNVQQAVLMVNYSCRYKTVEPI